MPLASPSKGENKVDDLEFKWGKKRAVGGPKKDIKFYESFTYDRVEYYLYDCVYISNNSEPEPYIGKLIKIWEQSNRKKKIKVLWFFRPIEIFNWLGGAVVHENEIFLAIGDGVGVANINPLEVLVGKCNVICTSKDVRNPQPSVEDVKTADYIFCRTFDVGKCVISDCIGDNVGGLEVRYVFNQKDFLKSSCLSKFGSSNNDVSGKVAASNGILVSPSRPDTAAVARDEEAGGLNVIAGGEVVPFLNEKTLQLIKSADENKSEVTASIVVNEVKSKADKDSKLPDNRSSEKARVTNSSAKFSGAHNLLKSPVSEEDENVKNGGTTAVESYKEHPEASECVGQYKSKGQINEDSSVRDGGPIKKVRLTGTSSKALEGSLPLISLPSSCNNDKLNNKLQKLSDDSDGGGNKPLDSSVSNSHTSKGQFVGDAVGLDKGASIKKTFEKKAKSPDNTLLKPAAAVALDKADKADQTTEVTRRPDADRSKWFKGLPWEERLQSAHEQGTLVLLENLDASYSSSEIEDIVWHGFTEKSTAKIIQRTIYSSPHSGQAFVIFKTKEAAEAAVRKLNQGCLMLPNGRPLVGSMGMPAFPGRPSKFPGHMSIEKAKLQLQRGEMRKAVSTSHCSQPNTIEYEMAMEWRLLQAKSDLWWKQLYKQHGEELRKLWNSLKTK